MTESFEKDAKPNVGADASASLSAHESLDSRLFQS